MDRAGSYPARRLARTEISRAFAEATKDAADLNPFVDGLTWNLSGRHVRPDECDDRARRSDPGLPKGTYRVATAPRLPSHPHCRCFWTQWIGRTVEDVVAMLREQLAGGGVEPAEPLYSLKDLPDRVSETLRSAGRFFRSNPARQPLMQDVSNAITIRAVPSAQRFRDALQVIDQIHADGVLPKIGLFELDLPDGREGEFTAKSILGPGSITISDRSTDPVGAVWHEVGHFLDVHGFRDTRLVFSSNSANTPEWRAWRSAVQASPTVKTMRDAAHGTLPSGVDSNSVNFRALVYLLRPEELWARSYEQFIAMRAGRMEAIRRQVELDEMSPLYRYQWNDQDFAPIAAAIESLLRSKGWLR